MEEAYNYLLNDVGLKYGDTVIAGISGGPDSMALLHLLTRLKIALDLEIVCAQVNHNTGRDGQLEEQQMVGKYCQKNNIVFEPTIIESYGDDNFENEARNFRYNFFNKLVKKYNAKYVLTAHHGDDLIETILMRIVRGSTLKGYSGFKKVVETNNYTLLRPLIHVTKSTILDYCKKNKIKYMLDSSNENLLYTRNRYRKNILPLLKKEDKNVHDKFYKFSKTLLEYNDYIDKQVSGIVNKVYNQNVLNIEEYLKQEELIQTKIIYYMLEKYYQDDLMLINDHHVELIRNLIKSNKANATIYLPNSIIALKEYKTLTLTVMPSNDNYDIEIIDYLNLPNGKNIEKIEDTKLDNNNICRLNSQEIVLPLYVRNKLDGDKMTVKGMLGKKKVSDIFINEKVSAHDRMLWPVVCDSKNNIVWLPGLKKSKFNKTKEEKYDIILKYY